MKLWENPRSQHATVTVHKTKSAITVPIPYCMLSLFKRHSVMFKSFYKFLGGVCWGFFNLNFDGHLSLMEDTSIFLYNW